MSRTSPDILKPCGGVVPPPALGGCWQHHSTKSLVGYDRSPGSGNYDLLYEDSDQPVWENVTQVVDFADSGWVSTGIDPYERPWDSRNQFCWAYEAGGNDCEVQQAGGPGTGNPSHDFPTTCSFLDCIVAPAPYVSEKTVNEGIYHNCYFQTSETTSFAACKFIGFKSLIAKKIWQGRQSYTSRDIDTPHDGFSWCCTCNIHNYDPEPDPNKYCGANGSADVSYQFGGDPDYTTYGSATCAVVVDSKSGNTTNTAASSSGYTGSPYSFDPATWANLAMGYAVFAANGDKTILLKTFCAWVSTYSFLGTPDGAYDGVSTSWTLTWVYGVSPDPAQAQVTIDYAAGTLTAYSETELYDYETDTWSKYTSEYDEISVSATGISLYHYDHGACPGPGPEFGVNTYSANGALTNLYTSANVIADWLECITDYWTFPSLVQLPWRYRSYENNRLAPLVTYDEHVGSPYCTGDNSVGGNDWAYTGEIVGKPSLVPTAPFWNGRHVTYEYRQCTEEGEPSWKQRGYGEWGGYSGLPNEATMWPTLLELYNDYNGTGIPEGAFLAYQNGALWGAVNAQILQGFKGYNFARPAGALDRFMLDPQYSNCIDHVPDTSSVVISVYDGQTSNVTGYHTCSIWGTSTEVDGVWMVNGNANGTCSLVKRFVSGSDFPDYPWGYATDTTFGHGMICRNRWFGGTPPILGHVDIVSITKATPVTISLMEEQKGIINEDSLWIRGCVGATELNNHVWQLKPIGTEHTDFALIGTTSASFSTNYTGSGYIVAPFAADWKWNSDRSRQNFVIGEFSLNGITGSTATWLRNYGEYQRLQGQSASNCSFGGCEYYPPTNEYLCPIGTMISEPTYPVATYSQSCVPFNACSPNVVHIRPKYGNTATFPHSVFVNLPSNFTLDEKYGNWYQKWIIQSMPDPLNPGAPPCPCSAVLDEFDNPLGYDCDCSWGNDGGLCLGKQTAAPDFGIPCIDYYADTDVYEAMCFMPDGAPALPQGLHLTQSYFIPQIGSINPALSGLGYQPWYIWLARENCVCTNGRMAAYYSRNGFTCEEVDTPLL